MLAPLTEPGLYPIQPTTSEWFLDKNRQKPVLRVKRRQLPLAPGFALTAHASQGEALPAAIVDLQAPEGASKLTSYVALSRVRDRLCILIFRCFNAESFRQGPPEGPSVLLQKLRNGPEGPVNWQALRVRCAPSSKFCGTCSQWLEQSGFTEWGVV